MAAESEERLLLKGKKVKVQLQRKVQMMKIV